MEQDLNLGEETEVIEYIYEIDYHSYINSAVNAIMALDGLDVYNERLKKTIERTKSQSIDLICKSINKLSEQFNEEHEC